MGKSIKVNDLSYVSSNLGQVTYLGVNSNNVFKITAKENLTLSFSNNLLYNDNTTLYWKYYEANDEIELANGNSIAFKGSLVPTENGIGTFTVSGNFEVSGNLLELNNYEQMKPNQFKNLFKNCTTLTDASNLVMPDYTVQNCYEGMFFGCTSLINSPKLIAEILTDDCYKYMFYGCTSLNHIVCYNVSDISEYVLLDWINGVASSGVFEINYNGEWNNTNKASHIPTNWTINNEYNYPWENEYLQFDVLTDGTIVWLSVGTECEKTISYSKDHGTTWTEITATSEGVEINVVTGDNVLFKGITDYYALSKTKYSAFTGGTATYNAKGNIMSMLYGDNFIGQIKLIEPWALSQLFNGSNIVSAEYVILPATILTNNCYRATFAHCSLLIKSPKKLPAMNLSENCYYYMFDECASMITHPELPASTLINGCYIGLFHHCFLLTYIICLAQFDISTNNISNFYMGKDDTVPTGTFIKHPNAIWARPDQSNDYAGIPSKWIIKDYKENK